MNEQENFWAGEFGNNYIARNSELRNARYKIWCEALARTQGISSVIELGANIGLNLKVIKDLCPQCDTSAVELNEKACELVKKTVKDATVFNESILSFTPKKKYDLAFVCGVLIHIAPENLKVAYKKLYDCSGKYVVICEYFNPTPMEVKYRDQKERMWKRDFAAEFLDSYNDFKLLDYGFSYRRDPMFPGDDLTWFLMEKC